MKNIIKFLYILLAGVMLFSACGERELDHEEYSDATAVKEGKVFLSFVDRTFMFEGVDTLENFVPEDIVLYARVLGPPPAENVVVNFAIADSSTAIEDVHYTLSSESITIPAGKATGTVTLTLNSEEYPLGDAFKLYFELTGTNSTKYPLHQMATFTTYTFIRDCALDILVFDGTFGLGYQGADIDPTSPVAVSPIVDVSQIKLEGIWLPVDSLFLKVNPDATLTDPWEGEDGHEGQYIGLYNADYGRVRFEDITDGIVLNKCTGEFEFVATPTLPDSGYWWGGAKHFRLAMLDGKMVIVSVDNFHLEKPVKMPQGKFKPGSDLN